MTAPRSPVAETSIEATVLNTANDLLEGDFHFRLPPGAVITGYALDVGGRMIDRVLVERPRAKAFYDARVRVRVDPGVAEVASDNLFHAQVNPILPGLSRTVWLRFVMAITPTGFHLPISVGAPAEGWRMSVKASGIEAAPVIRLAGGDLMLTRTAEGYAGSVERRSSLQGESARRPLRGPRRYVVANP